ncbi:hypothetical protein RhiJN_05480 [Ceratobasidium sp. AG-Ba]|nr:hypothetical protein RhiJN_05480 [Ceratobasidium sp. AG-Ba]QRW06406.1 hypothetical protein RhiLY_05405 [Ceratobasidium sp. AG-Ba]
MSATHYVHVVLLVQQRIIYPISSRKLRLAYLKSAAHVALGSIGFYGKIASIDFNSAARTPAIHFQNPSAAKTALMLNGTLDGSAIAVILEIKHEDPPRPEYHD